MAKATTKSKKDGPAADGVTVGIAKIDFGTPAVRPAISTSKYPLLEKAKELADKVLGLFDKVEAVADPFKSAKLDMVDLALPQYYDVNKGKMEAPTSMVAYGSDGRGVLVNFQERYKFGDEKELVGLLGPDATRHFRQAWSAVIDGDLVPPAVAGDFFKEFKELASKFGLTIGMATNKSAPIRVAQGIKPTSLFHQQRHVIYDPTTNKQIHKICEQVIAVKCKGVK